MVRTAVGALIGVVGVPACALAAPKLTTIYTFTGGADGGDPSLSALTAGPDGGLYGTTKGGTTQLGTAFRLLPPGKGKSAWSFTLLHSFTGGTDGGGPSNLIADAKGNLFGLNELGGDPSCSFYGVAGCGLLFELSPPASLDGSWKYTVLYTFNGVDGAFPQTGIVGDARGNLFGTAIKGSSCAKVACGTAFELSPPGPGQTQWTETILHVFSDPVGGKLPSGTQVIDKAGAVYGITLGGGQTCATHKCRTNYYTAGTVYKLTPPVAGSATWTETTIWSFDDFDGDFPEADLRLDAKGNLYGLTNEGGPGQCHGTGRHGCGVIFELSPPRNATGRWRLSLPWTFTGKADGRYPFGEGLTPFGKDFITTTSGSEVHDYGTIDRFVPSGSKDQPWREKTLFTFTNDANGENPQSSLLQVGGVYYGETAGLRGDDNGPASYGTVFRFEP